MHLKIFAIVHILMNDIILIDICLTCPCNTLRTSNSFARSGTGVVIDNDPHLRRTCKTSVLFAPLAVRVHAGDLAFQFYTPIKPRLGMSVTTQGGSGRQRVTGSGRNISKYRFVLLNVYRFRET